jgi:hypothetical protein
MDKWGKKITTKETMCMWRGRERKFLLQPKSHSTKYKMSIIIDKAQCFYWLKNVAKCWQQYFAFK